MTFSIAIAIAIAITLTLTSAATAEGLPATPKIPVTDVYHGVRVSEDYRWLEDGEDPAVRRWSEAQNATARRHLDNLPSVARLRARVSEILSPQSARFSRLAASGGNVRDGVRYPATLFLTGANDARVDPMQSRKMTARLQAATSSSAPILLRTSAKTGHGGSPLSERVAQTTDVVAFLFAQLDVRLAEPPAAESSIF